MNNIDSDNLNLLLSLINKRVISLQREIRNYGTTYCQVNELKSKCKVLTDLQKEYHEKKRWG